MDPGQPNLQIVPFFPRVTSDVKQDLDDLMCVTSPSSLNVPTTPTSVGEPESGLEGPEISSKQVVGGGGGGAFSQSICAVKSCQQVVFKLPSRPGYVVGLSVGSSGSGCRISHK